MVGAVEARPGPWALEGGGGWVGAAATPVACESPELLPCWCGGGPRLLRWELPLSGVSRLPLP